MKKINIAILFGGQSAEHEVSLHSAHNIAAALDRSKYTVSFIGITRDGRWLSATKPTFLPQAELPKKRLPSSSTPFALSSFPSNQKIDVVFPVLHGPNGEDGTIQGLLKLAHIPFVGASVLGSAIGMDKDVMKRLLQQANIPVGEFLVFWQKSPEHSKKLRPNWAFPVLSNRLIWVPQWGLLKPIIQTSFEEGSTLPFALTEKS